MFIVRQKKMLKTKTLQNENMELKHIIYELENNNEIIEMLLGR